MLKTPISGIVPDESGGFNIERADGTLVSKVDPVTRQATGAPQSFRVATGAPVAASLRQAPQRRKSATLSSVERSALMDELVDQLIALKSQVNALDRTCRQNSLRQDTQLAEHRAMLDAHAGVVNRMTLRGRLRWLVMGV